MRSTSAASGVTQATPGAAAPAEDATPRDGAAGSPAPNLVQHMAIFSGAYGGNTLEAIRECFERNVARIELDVHSLDGPDYLVYHERRLEKETTGSGSVGRVTPDEVRAVRYLDAAHKGRPPLLSEVIALARGCTTELQLDLKDWRPMPEARLRALSDTVAPIKDRVVISTGQDWNLRRLHALDPDLAYGFDPGHYLDDEVEGSPFFLPQRMGAYGYRDDHPLAVGRTEDTAVYLAERMSILDEQVPGAREYFLSYRIVLKMLDDGFDVVGWLHDRGRAANVWTLDYGEGTVGAFERCIAAGVDRITTNTTPAWLAAQAQA